MTQRRAELRCQVRVDDGGRLAAQLAEQGLHVTDRAPDVVVAGGFEAVREAAGGEVRLVALAERPERRLVSALLDLGAHGVATVDTPPEAVGAVVRAVAAGFTVVPAEARQTVHPPVLTTRQKQILSLVVLGLSNAEIATRLYVSEVTVKSHLTKVFSLLGVRSRKEAVALIHDPTSGLGPGILGIPEASRLQQGYGRPTFRA